MRPRILGILFILACEHAPAPTPTPTASPTPATTPSKPPPAETSDRLDTTAGPLTIHPVHHGSFWFAVAGKTVWVDPWSKGPLDGPKADIVLITDVHADHYDPAGLAAVRGPAAIVVAPKIVADQVPGALALANGERKELGVFNLEAIPMYNLERGPEPGKLYHDKGRGNGYVVTVGGKRIYISGDTECTPEMRALADINVAFVCMNLPFTMPPAEAATCVAAFKPKVLYPYHYRDSDLGALEQGLTGSGVELRRRDWYPAQ